MRRWIYEQEDNKGVYHMIEEHHETGYLVYFDIRKGAPKGHYAGKVKTMLDGHRTIKAFRAKATLMAADFDRINDITFNDIQDTLKWKSI